MSEILLPGRYLTVLFALGIFLFATTGSAQDSSATTWSFGGHTKYQYIHTRVPGNSVLQDISGDSMQDHNLEARLKLAARRDDWDFSAHAQFITVHSDALSGLRDTAEILFTRAGVINDDRRWFDLTHEISNQGKNATVVRLDRFDIGYTSNKAVIRFGRQAISWGNGMMFNPMDMFNPFDPAAVDKEYKAGDDMLYAQYLQDNGNDLQAVTVVRRNLLTGEVDRNKSSLAGKYHGFWGSNEYDVMLADHYGDTIFGFGTSMSLGGAVWRADVVWANTESEDVFSAVTGASYSWVAGGHNWSGNLEYFYNGFGQSDGDYSPAALATNPELVKRLARGELFSLARHYVGVSAMVELTPLLNLTPNMFINLVDPSALAQLVLAYDWKQDLQVLAALNFPIGPDGSEYGGINSTQPGLYFSTGVSLFAQLAWYF